MTGKKEIFKALVSNEITNTVRKNKERIKNRARMRESQQIALKVLSKLEEPGWSQARLAKEMGVTPQQITKIVRGTENLTLETQVKLQEILDIPILATYYERKADEMIAAIKFKVSEEYFVPSYENEPSNPNTFKPTKECKMEFNIQTLEYKHSLKEAV
jgi:transcriptional regulator with XRE-family HTH domain